jgi:hypothetical protein
MYILYSEFPEDCHLGWQKDQQEFTNKDTLIEVAKMYKWLTDDQVKLKIDKIDLDE